MSFGNSPNILRLLDEKQLIGEENWRPFKHKIMFTIQSKGLNRYLDRTIPRPNSYPGPIYPSIQTPTPLFSPNPCLEGWELRDRLVAGAIISNITDPVGLGIDETKRASKIGQTLVKRFKKRDEQCIHLADTSLQQEKYNSVSMMEDHEKQMRNLLKKVYDLEGMATDAQFCRIVISSMPIGWKQDVCSVPGTTSAEAFTYLHTWWYEKEEKQDTKRVKVLMAAHPLAPTPTVPNSNPPRTSNRPAIICNNCSKPGHIARKCWAKGG